MKIKICHTCGSSGEKLSKLGEEYIQSGIVYVCDICRIKLERFYKETLRDQEIKRINMVKRFLRELSKRNKDTKGIRSWQDINK